MRFPALVSLCLLSLSACTSNESVFSDKVTVDPVSDQNGIPQYVQSEGQQSVKGGAKISWFACTQKPSAGYMVLINPGPAEWTKDDACKNPAALAFLAHGFNVASLSRPSKEILGDDAAVGQMKETVEFLEKGDRRLAGLWSAGEGSVLTLRLARQRSWPVLIIGNGIYDLEQTLKEATDQEFLTRLKALPGSSESSFVEKRSAAWDLGGLPKVVYLYHGGKNSQVSSSQATQFKNSLAASEHQAQLFILDEDTQNLRPEYHRGVLGKILDTYQKPE